MSDSRLQDVKDTREVLGEVKALLRKQAFQPMAPPAPPQGAPQPGMAPPQGDPNAMAAQQGMPMDPAMAGAAPPPGPMIDPKVVEGLMQAVEQLAAGLEQIASEIHALKQEAAAKESALEREMDGLKKLVQENDNTCRELAGDMQNMITEHEMKQQAEQHKQQLMAKQQQEQLRMQQQYAQPGMR